MIERQESNEYFKKILNIGISINKQRYHYVGQSSSQLKKRRCLLYQANKGEIQEKLDGFGNWSEFRNVAKRAKKIGLLFTSGTHVFSLPISQFEMISDIEMNGHCFIDGCGFISSDLIKEIAKKMSLEFRTQRHYPSVVQIQYLRFKGILLRKTGLAGKTCEFRKSMEKFTCKESDDFYVVDYSKPYSYGRLNFQIITLLSVLGVPDKVFWEKQAYHYRRLQSMLTDTSVAFEYLLAKGKAELAGKLFENCSFTEQVTQYLNEEYQNKLETSKKANKTRKSDCSETKTFEKLRILVEKSRFVFAAADPTEKLKEQQCFFRPTIGNKPTTIVGPIFMVRNPCYYAGDILMLEGVKNSECEDIVDVLLFSVKG